MTDNDIIKALERCSGENGKDDCLTCPNFKGFADCKEDLSALALDLINRQQAEIEELKHSEDVLYKAKEQLRELAINRQAEIERLNRELRKIKSDLKWYLNTNEENGVVYIPEHIVRKMTEVKE